MKRIFSTLISLFTYAIISGPAEASPQSDPVVTKKAFDFVVGVDGTFKTALSTASQTASAERRFYIFFPNGEYAIGTLTGDANQKTTISTSNISFIGQDIDSTVISSKATNESISTTATLHFNNANNLYLQDLTILNKGNYGDPAAASATGRYVALQDQGDKNIYRHVKLLSNQDTYYSLTKRSYWEKGEIHGFVDFICGYGDIFFNSCLLYLEQRSSVVITAPSTQTSWGYVFMDCTIDGKAGDGYRLGRPWSNQPKCVYINTIMKKVPASEGWGEPMNVVPALFAEYNSKTASGATVNLSGRRTTYTKDATTVTLNPVLTTAQAAQYTIKSVVGGNDNWQPETMTKQVAAPVVALEGASLRWNNDDNALCWAVFKNNRYFKCVTTNSCDVTAGTTTEYSVRAANAMGGLGPVSNKVGGGITALSTAPGKSPACRFAYFDPVHETLRIDVSAAPSLQVTIIALNGKTLCSKTYRTDSGSRTVTVPLGSVRRGIYLVKTAGGGREQLHCVPPISLISSGNN